MGRELAHRHADSPQSDRLFAPDNNWPSNPRTVRRSPATGDDIRPSRLFPRSVVAPGTPLSAIDLAAFSAFSDLQPAPSSNMGVSDCSSSFSSRAYASSATAGFRSSRLSGNRSNGMSVWRMSIGIYRWTGPLPPRRVSASWRTTGMSSAFVTSLEYLVTCPNSRSMCRVRPIPTPSAMSAAPYSCCDRTCPLGQQHLIVNFVKASDSGPVQAASRINPRNHSFSSPLRPEDTWSVPPPFPVPIPGIPLPPGAALLPSHTRPPPSGVPGLPPPRPIS